jgi:Na+-driven multidrug efflux pump
MVLHTGLLLHTLLLLGAHGVGCIVAYMTWIFQWAIGISLSATLAFATLLQLRGLFIGVALGTLLLAVAVCIYLARMDWPTEVERAKDRLAIDAPASSTSSNNGVDVHVERASLLKHQSA